MKDNWENHLAAWHLAEAGRWDEALDAASATPSLHNLLSQRAFRPAPTEDPVVAGWQFYYRGKYGDAIRYFLEGEAEVSEGWRSAWSCLGVAKVASDTGWWRVGLAWCAEAWARAANEEHMDLLAQIAGARGEILLRAGRPLDAAAAFAEDRALLPPGSRYQGRIRCYEAHAWARLGANGRKAADLAYRMALHTPGESASAAFAAAGLALLAARENCGEVDQSEWTPAEEGLPRFWVLVAMARMATSVSRRTELFALAAEVLPEIYFAEHWWLANWRHAIGAIDCGPPDLRNFFPTFIPSPSNQTSTLVAEPVALAEIIDAAWWTGDLPQSETAWWQMRDCFMP